MKLLKKNGGFTLVELVVAMAVGTLAAAAAVSLLYFGVQSYGDASRTAMEHYEIQAGIRILEDLAAENRITSADGLSVQSEDGLLAAYDPESQTVLLEDGTVIMDRVSAFSSALEGRLLTVAVTVGDGEEAQEYSFCVFCRLIPEETAGEADPEVTPPPEEAASFAMTKTPDALAMLETAVTDETNSAAVRSFLQTLAAQRGSTGRIRTGSTEGEYYSQWYIGSYEENPDWNSDTPWCACFVSWALDQCSGSIRGEVPRYANVDTFWVDLVTADSWKKSGPRSGDLIFFDWIQDGSHDPQHVGVVIAADESRVYTIEGNVNGQVMLCDYALEDGRILGYGLVDWTE